MKLFIICSKSFYKEIPPIQQKLEEQGHFVILPNSYDSPFRENIYRKKGQQAHAIWKAKMFSHSIKVIEESDAVLVLNFQKNGIENYIGGATFLEMYDAFRLGKKIFLYNNIPVGILRDEIIGFNPTILNSDLTSLSSF